MNNTPIPTERKDRLRREAKGEAAYPRRDFWEELTSEDPFWSDLRRQYPDLDFEDLLQRHYKPRFLNVLDEQGKVLQRVNIRPEGLEEEEIQFFLQRFGFPYITLRLRLRRQGGAYYGIQTFQATHIGPPPRPPHLPAPVALAIQAPSPPPQQLDHAPLYEAAPLPPLSFEQKLSVLCDFVIAAAPAISEAVLKLNAEAQERDRVYLLEQRVHLLNDLQKQTQLPGVPEAIQTLLELEDNQVSKSSALKILKLWSLCHHRNRLEEELDPVRQDSGVQTSERLSV